MAIPYTIPNVREIFGTNVIIEHCPNHHLYAQEHIITKLTQFIDQFSDRTVPEQRGKAKTSCGMLRNGPGAIANIDYLQPLMGWIKDTVWKNRHYLQDGSTANGIQLGRNWMNEMFEGCSGISHNHNTPVAVFYVRIPPGGADLVFTNGDESVAAGAVEGDLLIHDRDIKHSVSEHKSPVSRICLILEFSFVEQIVT